MTGVRVRSWDPKFSGGTPVALWLRPQLARELRAEDLAEEMIEIADDPCVWVEKIGADGRAVRVLEK